MTTTTWLAEQLACYPTVDTYQNVVFSVAWRVNAVDGEHSATAYGTQSLGPADADTTFTPYEDLTQEQVVGWVKDAMGADQVASIEANLAAEIERQINPPMVTPALPWAAA